MRSGPSQIGQQMRMEHVKGSDIELLLTGLRFNPILASNFG
jgi:hypothetical protein